MGRDGARVLGVGIDLADVPRIAAALGAHGARFVGRVLGPEERAAWRDGGGSAADLAVRFALKEACLKALGTGWARGVAFDQVVVRRAPDGSVRIALEGAARDAARRLGVREAVADGTERSGRALAFVVLWGEAAPLTTGREAR